ncbi:MAG: DUF3443 domain-containing protein [Rhodoferax sp.]|uniref:DUF3443 domain-containing protein n=1 Tax=Rhodoferax sp. TaxID=50421 RepID=UPI0027269C4E|nr:DUF3443 domain-containing protein [Rhodoferax sp.]MDO8450733.1 DUF3443 domain-containing protein [Rhodoferax sp.]
MYFSDFLIRAVLMGLAAALVAACGGGGGTSATSSVPLENNVMAITVDSGPANTGYNVNRLYASVRICVPGTITCQTIDHVLVDTGSTGLRLLSTAVSPALSLSRVTGGTGFPLLNCAQFVDNSFAWGPVATADIVLGGKTAASVPIQIIGDPAFNSLAAACSSGGTAITTAATLGANGIVGLGLFKEDCGSGCAVIPANGFYYTCADFTCTTAVATTASISKQVANPVSLFATDNNGVLIDLPAVGTISAPSLSGSLIFGMGTQANNQLVPSAVLTTNASGYVTTLLAGQTLSNSFIDTGSNGLFFDLASIPVCEGASIGFYCPPPASRVDLSATLVGTNAVAVLVSFAVDNALSLFATGQPVLPTLAGDIGYPQIFDWGLPFFYGRRVFIGIEGQPSSLGTGPLYAF